MRLLVTGSRTWDDADYIRSVLDGLLARHDAMLLCHGACPTGADAIADQWARERHAEHHAVFVVRFPADWDGLGRAAGLARNAAMVKVVARYGNRLCHAFIRDNSRGASHCAKHAHRAGIPVTVHRYEDRLGRASVGSAL